MKPYVILLCRKSTNEERNQQNSLDYQERITRESFPQFSPDKIVKLSETGTEDKGVRTEFKMKFLDIIQRKLKEGKEVVCLAHAIDRYTRNFTDFAKIYNLHTKHGVKFYSCNGNLTNPQEALLFSIQVAFADQFIKNMKEKQAAGIEESLRKGKYPGGSIQGYVNVPKKKGMRKIDPHSAQGIKIIFQEYATGEHSLNSYLQRAKELAEIYNLKIRDADAIRRILRREFYMGFIKYRGKLYKGAHDPIVSKQLFNVVQDILDSRTTKDRSKRTFAWSEKIKTPDGKSLIPEKIKKKLSTGKITYYTYYRDHGKKLKAVKETELFDMFEKYLKIVGRNIDENKVRETVQGLKNDASRFQENEVAVIKREIGKIESAIDELTEMRIQKEITAERFATMQNKYLKKEARLKEKILEVDSKYVFTLAETLSEYLELLDMASLSLKNASTSTQKKAVSMLTSNCLYNGKDVDFKPSPFVLSMINNDFFTSWQGHSGSN